MQKIKTLLLLIFSLLIFSVPKTEARDASQITDWYIRSFESNIIVNTDSSLDITEKITADCGNLPDKHGIFRVLPTQYYPETGQAVITPVDLISITDFDGTPYKYQATNNRTDHTVTWKIGDANKTVTGVNNYEIKYHVKNTIRFENSNFDEFYWNLNGNFWELETDSYSATITFPEAINKESTKELTLYSGFFGEKDTGVATASWLSENQVAVRALGTLEPSEGITLSLTFPKNIISPYVPTFWEKYADYFYLFIPLLVLVLCYLIWSKYGRDPKINPTVVPEFEIPEKMMPMEMGMVYSDGILKTDYISAALINLAVKKIIKIEEIVEGKIFKHKDYKLIRLTESNVGLSESEISLLEKVFGGASELKLSDLKNKFYKEIPTLTSGIKNGLVGRGVLVASSRTMQYLFIGLTVVFGFFVGEAFVISTYLALGLMLSAAICFIFSFLMTRRTLEGLKLFKRIEGFKLYMNTAEKYRARFNEKENIFEKFLPYAIMFGMTNLWIGKMKQIYGEEYINTYHPYWFYGVALASFNADSLNSAISSVSSSMASTLASSPSSSGSGGGGFSGGGGGGGGGGGW